MSNTKSKEEIHAKTQELISRFKNGKERFHESAILHQVICSLARDADYIDIIDQLITGQEKLSSEYEKYVKGDSRPLFIPADQQTTELKAEIERFKEKVEQIKEIVDKTEYSLESNEFKIWKIINAE